ncbi:MAG: hypothetical protein D6695_00490 [Planctomycetota bacterium]|nr:MAG: hypothetical protein D6695_00490 [Planctomycetota bacterium]
MYSKLVAAMAVALLVPASLADVVDRVWWNPRISQPGGTDPFMGQSTDESLAAAGLLTQVGLTRFGNSIGSISFTNIPSTFSEDHYIEFSIIPGAGRALDVHDLILQAANNGAPMPLDRIVLRSETDGFTSDHAALPGPNSLQGNTGRPVLFDLESLPTLTDETTFRLYVWGINGPFGIAGSVATLGWGMWFADVDSNPVPMPASSLLLCAGALAVRRRR